MLSIKGLSFGYHKQRHQLDQLNLEVKRGDMLGLLGPNGAGKTTLVSLVAGLLTPCTGTISLNGHLTRPGRKDVALVPQEYAFYQRLSGRENLRYFAGMCGLRSQQLDSRLDSVVAECGLTNVQHQRAEQYSGGLKRRLNFAIALLQQPELLILDEPTANVDPQSRAFLLDIVRRLNRAGVTIIYTSHLLEEVESLCRSVAVMDEGRIVLTGKMQELLAEQQRLLVIHLATPLPPEIQAWPFIEQRGAQEWALDLVSAQQSPAALLTRLEQAGVTPTQIHFGQRRLEEIFFASIQRGMQE